MGNPKNKARATRRDDGQWYVTGIEVFPDHGPYTNKEEAQGDARGLQVMYETHRDYWHKLHMELAAIEAAKESLALEDLPVATVSLPEITAKEVAANVAAKPSVSSKAGDQLRQMIANWSGKDAERGVGVSGDSIFG